MRGRLLHPLILIALCLSTATSHYSLGNDDDTDRERSCAHGVVGAAHTSHSYIQHGIKWRGSNGANNTGGLYEPQGYMLGNIATGFATLTPKFASPLSLNLITQSFAELPSAGFNPSIVVLPPELARRLHPLARYVVTLRHSGDQCGILGTGDTKLRQGSAGSSILLLDESFQGLKAARILDEDGDVSTGEDVRVFVLGNKLLASLMLYASTYDGGPTRPQWHVKELHLEPYGNNSLKAWYQHLETPIHYNHVRNLGLLQKGAKELVALWWLGIDMDVRPLISLLQVRSDHDMHNSIHPIELPTEDAFLAIGHEHLAHGHLPFDWEVHKIPSYGYQYITYFVLFDRSPPYSIRHISEPFCFPSMHDNTTCEVIQFVGAAILESNVLSIAYGINDCEASIVRISLPDVLSFTRSGRALESQSAS